MTDGRWSVDRPADDDVAEARALAWAKLVDRTLGGASTHDVTFGRSEAFVEAFCTEIARLEAEAAGRGKGGPS